MDASQLLEQLNSLFQEGQDMVAQLSHNCKVIHGLKT